MERQVDVALPALEVPMLEAEEVTRMKLLAGLGWGARRIAKELGVARNTVRRYVRDGAAVGVQMHPGQRALDDTERRMAEELYEGVAEGNAVVVRDMLSDRGVEVGLRSVQRLVKPLRERRAAAEAATVRYESIPGDQLQIDFGEKRVEIGGQRVKVHFLVAVLGYSRRIFVKAFLSERQDDWFEGIAEAFRHFGGVPRTLLNDNPKALVLQWDAERQVAVFNPGYLAFCRDWGVTPRACRPFRARTKGKTESGVKYVKRNALAGRVFESFAQLERHLEEWMLRADERVHGTTHEKPRVRFERAERASLRPLPQRPLVVRQRRLTRRVANDAMVEVDTVRYSVPHRLVRERVEVAVGEHEVRVYRAGELVAQHRRCCEPFASVVDPSHLDGLLRRRERAAEPVPERLSELGRSLDYYAQVVERSAA